MTVPCDEAPRPPRAALALSTWPERGLQRASPGLTAWRVAREAPVRAGRGRPCTRGPGEAGRLSDPRVLRTAEWPKSGKAPADGRTYQNGAMVAPLCVPSSQPQPPPRRPGPQSERTPARWSCALACAWPGLALRGLSPEGACRLGRRARGRAAPGAVTLPRGSPAGGLGAGPEGVSPRPREVREA